MSTESAPANQPAVSPPSKHQLALMIWTAVFPTLTVLNLMLSNSLKDLPVIVRTFILATIAVPIVIYGLMSHLHRLRTHIIGLAATRRQQQGAS
jgi:antibiotic biosynthesis monooxygenase (ABM) superfamily enzyme